MYNLYTIDNDFFSGFSTGFLNIIYFTALFAGILTIVTKNPVVSVLFLIMLFGCIAVFLIFIGLKFIGLSYLLVYVGAVSILFLFILMLINIRISELLSQTRNSIPLVIIASLVIYFIITNILPSKKNNLDLMLFDINSNNIMLNNVDKLSENINYVSNFNWDGNLLEFNPMETMGNIMFTSYPMWLIVTSIILLLGMTGVIVITIAPFSNKNEN